MLARINSAGLSGRSHQAGNSDSLNSEYLVVIPVYDYVRLLDVSVPLELFGRVQRTSTGKRIRVITTALTENVTTDGGLRNSNKTL